MPTASDISNLEICNILQYAIESSCDISSKCMETSVDYAGSSEEVIVMSLNVAVIESEILLPMFIDGIWISERH